MKKFFAKRNAGAFTLTELLIVIAIIGILGLIAFLSYAGFAKNARDSARTADINMMVDALNRFQLKHGYFPQPDNSFNVTYSGSIVWTQGAFSDTVFRAIGDMSKKPVDPLTGNDYTYSVTNLKQEFQVASMMEMSFLNAYNTNIDIITPVHASSNRIGGHALIKGNYNGKFIKVLNGENIYILGAPSIITSEITSVDVSVILNNKNFVYTGYNNLPSTYLTSSTYSTGGLDFTPGSPSGLLFEGNEDELQVGMEKLNFAQKLKTFYSSSILEKDEAYGEILSQQPSVTPDGTIALVNKYMTHHVGGLLGLKSTAAQTSYVSNYLLDFEKEGGYSSTSTGTASRTTSEKKNGSYSLMLKDPVPDIDSGMNKTCFSVKRSSAFPFAINLNHKVIISDYAYVTVDAMNLADEGGYYNEIYFNYMTSSSTPAWSRGSSYTMEPGNYAFLFCLKTDDVADTVFFDDISFDYVVNGACGWAKGQTYETLTSIPADSLCNQGLSSVIKDNGAGKTFSWSCNGTLGGATESCSAFHVPLPTDIVDFEMPGGYSVTSGTWTRSTADKYNGSYSIESNTESSCFTVTRNLPFPFEFSYYVRGMYTGESGNDDRYGVDVEVDGSSSWIDGGLSEHNPEWNRYKVKMSAGSHIFKFCTINYGFGNPVHVDDISFNRSGVCSSAYDKSSSIEPSSRCYMGTPSNFVDNGVGSTYNWDCLGNGTGATNVSCRSNHIASISTYPGCNAPDIVVEGTTIAACNIGSIVSGTGVSSYGHYFQWGRNKAFPSADTSQEPTVISGSVGINATTDTYGFVWDPSLPWNWTNDDISDNWGYISNSDVLKRGPCPAGYHVPAANEWVDIIASGFWPFDPSGMTEPGVGALVASSLKIPYAGVRDWFDGTIKMDATDGCYWASTGPEFYLTISNSFLTPDNWGGKGGNGANGYPIRCFRN